jgi:acyl-CoA synthetase (AMP-forming)/AMP-acid ligase II
MILSSEAQILDYTQNGWWGTDTLIDLFDKNVKATPNAFALIDPPNRADLVGSDPHRYIYAELKTKVDNLATGLLNAGLRHDDVIMVQLPNIAELVITYLAAARIGAIVSPLPVQYRTHELRQTMAIVQPKAFITVTSFANFNYVEMVQSIQLEVPGLKTIFALGPNLPDSSDVQSLTALLDAQPDTATLDSYLAQTTWTANDIFTICWTSGTEAEPKGVPRSHNLWISIAYATTDAAELKTGDTLLNPFPLVNMSGIGGMLVPWLLTGGKLVMHHPLNLPVFLQQIVMEKVNYTVAPPVLMNMLLVNTQLLANVDLSNIKVIGSGSAPLSAWMTTEWKTRHNIDVLNMFGSNEGCAFVSAPQEIPDPAERARYFPRYGVEGYNWVNRAVRGMKTKLVDPVSGSVVTEPGQSGELLISGPTIFPGYYNRSEITAKSFDSEGYFRTGDLFEITGEGDTHNRYRFVGRLKDLIIRGGMKIAPEEIESLIMEHPKVAEVAVFGVPDRLEEERICAVIVPKKDQEVDLHEIQEFLKAKDIAAYKLPKKLVIMQALPRNPVGKVLKRDLRQQHLEQ